MITQEGDVIMVKVGRRQYETVIVNGVQRFRPTNKLFKYLFDTGKLDLNDLAAAFQAGKFTQQEYLDLYTSIGYSVSGLADLSMFYNLTINNPVWKS